MLRNPTPATDTDVVDLKELILRKAHDSHFAMHLGGTKMYCGLQEMYWWPNMKREVVEVVAKCLTCQRVKAELQVLIRLLQSISLPECK
ncbi:zinc finger and BTB domain-containing protein 11-like [Gossypium australe]|uniref:Zinc finger and BTB domain-containing protein 11-like n=1 Tax=Gossypium australe TaxID=47621 RepID=A0A5B6VIV6_9ROSI|nr:zinc finger and BTB domain-containing protein 11-like [Gossypium australe]